MVLDGRGFFDADEDGFEDEEEEDMLEVNNDGAAVSSGVFGEALCFTSTPRFFATEETVNLHSFKV